MMDHAQSVPAGVTSRSERELIEAMFAALAAASSFVHIETATSAEPAARRAPRRRPDRTRTQLSGAFDPALHTVPRFWGWVNH